MDVVIDTSAIVAVITGAPERDELVNATRDASLIAPPSVHWEIGNAFSSMARRNRIDRASVTHAIGIYRSIPVRFIDIDLEAALAIALEHRLYAYDAYLIACAQAANAPLLTLDRPLRRVALESGADVMEIE
jgi:predicted nucleic acid-binding protein